MRPTGAPRRRRRIAGLLAKPLLSTPRAVASRDHDEIVAGAPFYGYGGCDATTKPVLWQSGKLDLFSGFSDEATALQLGEDLAAAGNKDYTVKVYPAVGHGFMNVDYEPYDSEKAKDEGFQKIGVEKTFYPYNATVADAAWGSLFDFFEKYL